MSTHTGKIGRLDSNLRHELGLKIENNEPGKEIVDWLNGRPEVQESLKNWFEDRKITEQNLSDWRQGGHLDWLRLEETRRLARQLAEETETLEEDEEGYDQLTDRLSVRLTTELAKLMTLMVAEEKDPAKRWEQLKEMHKVLSQMRKDDHRALKARMEREQWKKEKEDAYEAETARMVAANRKQVIEQIMAPVRNQQLGAALGMGKMGEELVTLTEKIRTGQPWEDYRDELTKKWMREDARKGQKQGAKSPANPGKSR